MKTKAINAITNTPPTATPMTVLVEVLEDRVDPREELELPGEKDEVGVEGEVLSEVGDVPSPEVEF